MGLPCNSLLPWWLSLSALCIIFAAGDGHLGTQHSSAPVKKSAAVSTAGFTSQVVVCSQLGGRKRGQAFCHTLQVLLSCLQEALLCIRSKHCFGRFNTLVMEEFPPGLQKWLIIAEFLIQKNLLLKHEKQLNAGKNSFSVHGCLVCKIILLLIFPNFSLCLFHSSSQ